MTTDASDPGDFIVRPRASHRKQRTADLQRSKLEPVQERSRRRNDQILEAVASLLERVNIEDLSHSDVAAAAGVSKASVHYHFPSVASMQLALGRRFDAEINAHVAEHQIAAPESWQDMIRSNASIARDWFNTHRPACEALLGPLMTRENRLAGLDYNAQNASGMLKRVRRHFEVPQQDHLESVFTYNGEIIDLFWSGCYLRRGFIDDTALEESLRASLGYLRNFLPDFLPHKSSSPAKRDPEG